MANYRTDFISLGSVGFGANNDPIWPGAAEVARAGYQAQCKLTGSCDPANAPNIVSYKSLINGSFTEQDAIKAIQNEVCSGNPVIMRFNETAGGQHFMLATGIALDGSQKQTLRLNNPGSRVQDLSKGAFFTTLQNFYPSIIGYILYHPSSDPSMILITAPMGIQFVVTDPLGRRAGFDPTTGTSYSEIPGATYTEQSINTPGDPGFTPSTLVDERYFTDSLDVPAGPYQVQVFSVGGGSYYLDYRSYDSTGATNDAHYKTGTLTKGSSATIVFQHSAASAPVPNATVHLHTYLIKKSHKENLKEADIQLVGLMVPFTKSSISLKSSFMLSIGGMTGYQLSLPASGFQTKTSHETTFYRYESKDTKIRLDSSGIFEIDIDHADLSGVDSNLVGSVNVIVDSVVGGTKLDIRCDDNFCSLERHFDRHDHDHDKNDDEQGRENR